MRKSLNLGLALLAGLSIGMTSLTTANAATWHKGTPKVARGYWYHAAGKQKSYYLFYGKSVTYDNYLSYSATQHGYFKLPGHGLSHVKYRSLGQHRYKLVGTDMNSNKGHVTIKATKHYVYYNHSKFIRRAPGKLVRGY